MLGEIQGKIQDLQLTCPDLQVLWTKGHIFVAHLDKRLLQNLQLYHGNLFFFFFPFSHCPPLYLVLEPGNNQPIVSSPKLI